MQQGYYVFYGAVVPDGYGVCYNPLPSVYLFVLPVFVIVRKQIHNGLRCHWKPLSCRCVNFAFKVNMW